MYRTTGAVGTFTQQQNTLSWDFGSPPRDRGVVAGDFNGGGKTDFMLPYADPTTGIIQFYATFLSNGDGTFTPVTSTVGTSIIQRSLGDFNGDGKSDYGAISGNCRTGVFGLGVYLGNGDGTFTQHSQSVTPLTPDCSTLQFVGDFSGDGRSDIVWAGETAGAFFLGQGDGTFSQIAFSYAGWSFLSLTTTCTQLVVGDFDGDGKTDFFLGHQLGGRIVFLSNGDGTFRTQLEGTNSQTCSTHNTGAPLVGDFNGDGKADYLFANYNTQSVNLSNGDGTFTNIRNTLPISFGAPTGSPSDTYLPVVGDFNGDGRVDYMLTQNSTQYVFLSNGDGTFAMQTNTIANSFGSPPTTAYLPVIGDFNGDGKTDYMLISGSTQYVFLANGGPTDLAQSITTGLGATTTFTYQPLTQASVYTKDTNATYPLQDIQQPMYVVSRVDTSNGIGGTYRSAYTYAGGKADLSGRGFLGFRQVMATDLQTGIVTTTNNRQDFPYIGQTASTTETLGSVTLSSTTNTYQFSNASGAATVSTPSNTSAPYQVSVAQSVAAGSDLDGTALPTVTTTSQYDAYGNPTQVVVSASDGFNKTTTNTYTNDTTNWFLGRLTGATVTSTAP